MTIKLKMLSALTISIEKTRVGLVFVLTQVKLAERLQSVVDNSLDGSNMRQFLLAMTERYLRIINWKLAWLIRPGRVIKSSIKLELPAAAVKLKPQFIEKICGALIRIRLVWSAVMKDWEVSTTDYSMKRQFASLSISLDQIKTLQGDRNTEWECFLL